VTESKLDDLVKGHFAVLDLDGHEEFIQDLEAAKNFLIEHRSQLDTSEYDARLPKAEIERRLSLDHLQSIQDREQNRFVCGSDMNLIRFPTIRFRELTLKLAATLESLLEPRRKMRLFQSGRNWYPRNGYMGWHTNANVQGFRLYCTHAPASRQSYFRYFDPTTQKIETSWDTAGWNFKCFRTDLEPLWHCVYSETDRISFGYGLMFPIDEEK
jgi:hypothetical protein